MATLMVPVDARPWPTLGPQVCDFIETNLVHGPGDLRGEPARLSEETRGLIYRAYEIHPRGSRLAGRRRFKRVGLSLRKGVGKTELAAWIAACELHPDAPVRCDGWDARGDPVGVGVRDPYIPMVAYTEEQSEDLAYGTLFVTLLEGPLAADFDIGYERIMRRRGDGKAVPLATAPNSRDGARTSFQVFDETGRLNTPRLKAAHQTMLANIPKRKQADAWSLEITTAPAPGEGSVGESTMEYAEAVVEQRAADARLFFFHRGAGDDHDLTTRKGLRAAVLEASGPYASWSDIDGIVDQWDDPTADRAYLERVWLNRLVQPTEKAFDALRWDELAAPTVGVPDGDLIVLGFDGARLRDATALIATHVRTGHQWPLGIWERPFGPAGEGWQTPEDEVDQAVAEAFGRWDVWRLYADPPYWESTVAAWAGRYGDKRVVEWWTHRYTPMAYAARAYRNAQIAGDLTHDGDSIFRRHIGSAHRREVRARDEDGQPLWVPCKERPDSTRVMDAAVAGCLSWEARGDAIAAGVLEQKARTPARVRVRSLGASR